MEKQKVMLKPISFREGMAYDSKGWDDDDVACASLLKGGDRDPSLTVSKPSDTAARVDNASGGF
jgi:hypothetical protein